jgi:hypothetical protein
MTIHQPSYESLAAKTVKGSAYSIAASGITLGLGLGRSILMARLLTPEDFGLVAFAMTLLNFTAPLRNAKSAKTPCLTMHLPFTFPSD